jgi:predicted PurR-regulated permease PerM
MEDSTQDSPRRLEDKAFLWLLLVVTLAFAWIVGPFHGAVLWASVIAILFAPLQRALVRRFGGRATLAALATLGIVVLIVILPLAFVGTALVQEAAGIYEKMKAGEINFGQYFRQVFDALPAWVHELLERFGLFDFEAVQERVSENMLKASQFVASRAVNFGQGTFEFLVGFFIMLYLLFFLLRDGDAVVARMRAAIPLRREKLAALLEKFNVVIRATIKGNLVVAILQGILGGIIFWFLDIRAPLLWAVLMAVLSLLPAVGTALVWGPVAIWFIATGSVVQGVVLIAYGVLVIGLVDNIVRPILVGKDTKMPDYMVLISTLGGLAIFGINGFIIGPVIAAMFMATWGLFSAPRAPAVNADAAEESGGTTPLEHG